MSSPFGIPIAPEPGPSVNTHPHCCVQLAHLSPAKLRWRSGSHIPKGLSTGLDTYHGLSRYLFSEQNRWIPETGFSLPRHLIQGFTELARGINSFLRLQEELPSQWSIPHFLSFAPLSPAPSKCDPHWGLPFRELQAPKSLLEESTLIDHTIVYSGILCSCGNGWEALQCVCFYVSLILEPCECLPIKKKRKPKPHIEDDENSPKSVNDWWVTEFLIWASISYLLNTWLFSHSI